jgi:hypothetical protein
MFAEMGVLDKVAKGEYTTKILASRVPNPMPAFLQPGTQSQEIGYYDSEGKEIARAHQYLQPDGTLGASKKPDPKRIVYQGTLYYLA